MKKSDFETIVLSQPGLTARGIIPLLSKSYEQERNEFMNSAEFLQHAIDSIKVLRKFKKTVLMTKWQKHNCNPRNLRGLIEWNCGRNVSDGGIIVAALYLGFRLDLNENESVCFNIFAPQLEGEFRNFRVRELIKKAVG